MDLEFEFSLLGHLEQPLVVGPGPFGTRMFLEVVGGTIEGDRVAGKVLTGGDDRVQQAVAAGAGTAYEDQFFRTSPRFETGDPRYAWLGQALFVGEGRLVEGPAVEYRVHRVT